MDQKQSLSPVQFQAALVGSVANAVKGMQSNNGLRLPASYSAGNALNAAYMILSDSTKGASFIDLMKRGEITKGSVQQALTDMVVQGLNPSKSQGYFIKYGKQLAWSRSYFGAVAIVKRIPGISGTPYAEVVHKGDTFEIGSDEAGRTTVKKFEPSFENQDNPLIGAFACIEFDDGHKEFTIMTKKQIDMSWSHTKTHGGGPQKEFPEEMAKRTVLNRAAKMVINTSDDSDVLLESVNRTTAAENDFDDDDKDKRRDVTPDSGALDALISDPVETPKADPKPVEPAKSADSDSESEVKQDATDASETSDGDGKQEPETEPADSQDAAAEKARKAAIAEFAQTQLL